MSLPTRSHAFHSCVSDRVNGVCELRHSRSGPRTIHVNAFTECDNALTYDASRMTPEYSSYTSQPYLDPRARTFYTGRAPLVWDGGTHQVVRMGAWAPGGELHKLEATKKGN